MFEYFIENEFFTVWQSDFLLGDFCTSQLLSIYNTWHSYIYSPPIYVRGVFLDISKAFDKVTKVWHKELVYKLKSFGINDLPDDI